MADSLESAITGCILGTALGDALGLPCEGLTRQRQKKLFRDLRGHRLLFGRGMVSDDTEHACMVAQALLVSAGEPDAFARRLERELRRWLLAVPAGVGFATLRACLKLCLGARWQRSGLFSAGNGPAMRSALVGVCYGEDAARLRELIRISTRITHTDPKAEYGALAVALAAHLAHRQPEASPRAYLRLLEEALAAEPQESNATGFPGADELLDLVRPAVASAEAGDATETFADSLGLQHGVSGYIYHTVPVVLHAWFRYPDDFQAAVIAVVRCGGDTDTPPSAAYWAPGAAPSACPSRGCAACSSGRAPSPG